MTETNFICPIYSTNFFPVIEGICNTVMAGLNCGTPSTIGWPMLRDSAFAFLSCQDEVTFTGMKSYHKGILTLINYLKST